MKLTKDFEVLNPYPGVIHLRYREAWKLNFAICRVQEFYENPDQWIRDSFFEFEDLIYSMGKQHKILSYDWMGFNIPGVDVDRFLDMYDEQLRPCEEEWVLETEQYRNEQRPYYLIATSQFPKKDEKSTLNHELAHAFFCLDKTYQKKMKELLKEIPKPTKEKIKKELLRIGYTKYVVEDEAHAYLATSTDKHLKDLLGIKNPKIAKPFRSEYKRYKQSLKKKD